MGIQKDRGLLQFENAVVDYWPEFGKNGKDKITISDVCRHEAGLQKFHKQYKPEDIYTEGILKNKIGEIIENDTALWPCD